MQEYIVTFYSHYNAIRLMHLLKPKDIVVTLAPVPRQLSSSCGTCVRFSTELDPEQLLLDVEFEQLVLVEGKEIKRVIDHR